MSERVTKRSRDGLTDGLAGWLAAWLIPSSSSTSSSSSLSFSSLIRRPLPPLFSRLSLPSSLEKREVSTHAVSRSVVKACSPSPSLLTTFSTSVLACRLSYSRRANQSAFRSNGPHDNYGCCHTHTRACTFSLYSCVCLFIEDFFRNERARKKKEGKEREALLFFWINCPLLYAHSKLISTIFLGW